MARPPLAAPRESGGVQVLGDAATVRGFRLAGLPGTVVDGAGAARAAFARVRESGAALVIVTEAVVEALGGAEAVLDDGVRPLVLAVPSAATPPGVARAADPLARRVQRALGLSGERLP